MRKGSNHVVVVVVGHTHLDQIQDAQLALCTIHNEHKVQRRVITIDYADLFPRLLTSEQFREVRSIQEIAKPCRP